MEAWTAGCRCGGDGLMRTGQFQICRNCERSLPVVMFWAQKRKKSGLFAECKDCGRRRNRKWIDSNRGRYRQLNLLATNRKRRRHPLRQMLANAKSRAKRAGIEFSLVETDIVVPTHCPILGIELIWNYGRGRGKSQNVRDRAPSLDRVDNSKGYTPDNIVVTSYRANRIKSDASLDELTRIAVFYDKLARRIGKDAGISGRFSALTDGQQEISLPDVQPHSKEKKGSLPIRNGRWRGLRSALS